MPTVYRFSVRIVTMQASIDFHKFFSFHWCQATALFGSNMSKCRKNTLESRVMQSYMVHGVILVSVNRSECRACYSSQLKLLIIMFHLFTLVGQSCNGITCGSLVCREPPWMNGTIFAQGARLCRLLYMYFISMRHDKTVGFNEIRRKKNEK